MKLRGVGPRGWMLSLSCILTAAMVAAQTNNGFQVVTASAGDDVCTDIRRAIASLPPQGRTVDARAVAGIVSCNVNPFQNVGQAGSYLQGGILLLLGPAVYQTSAMWVIPDKTVVRGMGRGDGPAWSEYGVATVIQGSPAISPAPVVVRLGNGRNPVFGTRLEELTVDCGFPAGAGNGTGIYSTDINEQSGVFNVAVDSCGYAGIVIDSVGAFRSPALPSVSPDAEQYSIEHVEIQPAGRNIAGSGIGLHLIGNGNGPATVHAITVNGLSPDGRSASLDSCVLVENVAGGSYSGIHIEHCNRGVNLGGYGSYGVVGVTFASVTGGPEVKTVVQINNAHTSSVTLQGVENYQRQSACTIRDFRSNVFLRNWTVVLYSFGELGGGLITTANRSSGCGK